MIRRLCTYCAWVGARHRTELCHQVLLIRVHLHQLESELLVLSTDSVTGSDRDALFRPSQSPDTMGEAM